MTNDTRFVYLRDDAKGGVTVAYRYDDERQAIEFNVARRNPTDQFVKAIGRELATDRLVNDGGYLVPFSAIEAYADEYNADAQRFTDMVKEVFGETVPPNTLKNRRGYRAVAGFMHKRLNPKIQPFNKRTMMIVLASTPNGDQMGFVVPR